MRKTVPLFGIAILVVIAFGFLTEQRDVNVLVFSKTAGYRHASIEAGIAAVKKLGAEHDFRVDATEDATAFTEATLRQYNVVFFLNTTLDVLNDAQQVELRRFIQGGGGFVGVHAAADTEYDWPWYNELVGGWFTSHPNNPNVREGVLHVADPNHPSTEGLPQTWTHTDEWYDYKDFKEGAVNVLLLADETSYKRPEENPASEPRPIAWYREFDGGRTFYTGLGHTAETYEEPLFLEHLLGGIQYAAGDGKPVNWGSALVTPDENRFTQTVLAEYLDEPMELDLLPDGRVIFVERRGDVHIYDPETSKTLTAASLNVHSEHEDGLIGMAVDPDFADNNWLYVIYSPTGDVAKQHVSRFVLEGATLDLASEKVLLEIATQREECCHSGGSMAFDSNGLLFISTGDDTNPFASDGYAPIDEREGRSAWDAQKSSANTNDLRGKILRIRPEADGSYSIPDGNLFSKDGSEGRPEIYVMGNRNPYRISIDPHTDWLYWGEIGPDAGADTVGRGPMGYDEINQARAAGNFGWPHFVADNQAYHARDFASGAAGPAFDPAEPVNKSPNNTGARVLPPAQPAFIWYPYGPSSLFPLVGEGGRSAMAGPVYHAADYAGSNNRLPEYYDGKLFVYEWMRGWIMAVTMDENGDYARMEPFMPSTKLHNPVDLELASDGTLYLLEYGPIWYQSTPEARLSRIAYVRGNRAPVARIEADRKVGAAPLTVQFSGLSSVDFDGDDLVYAWKFNEDVVQSDEAEPTFTFSDAGTYSARLVVTDPDGETAEAPVQILVGNDPPQIALDIDGNRSFYWDDVAFAYSVSVTDPEDGSLTDGGIDPGRVAVTIDYLPQGADLIASVLGHQSVLEASELSQSLVGKQLMEGSDCSACHQQNATSVGPSFVQIAERYSQETGAAERLAKKVIQGGGGSWGEVAMAPHPQLSDEEAAKMVEYILSLTQEAPVVSGLPVQGTYTPTAHAGAGDEGSYVIMATYTDRGGDGVGPLSAREVVTLRSPRVPAEAYDETKKGSRFVIPDDMPGDMGGATIYLGEHGAEATYKNVDLTAVGAITGTFAAPPAYASGGWVDLFVDSPDGQKLGTFDVMEETGGGVTNVTLTIDPIPGAHDLVFVYRNEKGNGLVCTGISFTFHHESATASAN